MMHGFQTLLLAALLLQSPALDSASPKDRMEAVEALARPGRIENIAPLAEALKKETRSDVRAAIVAGLARIGGREAVPVLADALRSDLDKDVRLQVIDSIQRLYIPIENPGTLQTIFNRVKSVFSEVDRPVVQNADAVDPALKAALAEAMQKDFSQEVRAASAGALGSLKAKDQIPVMIATLEAPPNREYVDVRLEIVRSLGLIRDASAGPALEKALRDPNAKIAQAAILSIGLVGYKEARGVIENTFRTDKDRNVKRKAIEALALMRDPATKPLFESLLGDTDDYYREMAAEGLARIDPDPAALKARYPQEKKPNVRNALAFGLAAADEDSYINDLANALDSRQAYQAEAYLYELGKFEGKMGELHRYLRSTNPKVRGGMARVLGNIGDPVSRQPIEDLTQDSNTEVAREAIAALRKITNR